MKAWKQILTKYWTWPSNGTKADKIGFVKNRIIVAKIWSTFSLCLAAFSWLSFVAQPAFWTFVYIATFLYLLWLHADLLRSWSKELHRLKTLD